MVLRTDQRGLLTGVLLTMILLTGIVDAISYLALGRVFVANMTGNVIFIGFALAGEKSLSVSSALVALSAFFVGAVLSGRFYNYINSDRLRLLGIGLTAQALLFTLVLCILVFSNGSAVWQMGSAALLAIAMAFQNTLARRIAMPGLATTVVLTSTLTDLGADIGAGKSLQQRRRLLAIVIMCLGACVGGIFVLYVSVVAALVLTLGLVIVLLALLMFSRQRATRGISARDTKYI